jgi:hypothetical protein
MSEPCVDNLAITIYLPYRRYITKYGAFEDKTLNDELDNIQLVSDNKTEIVLRS